LISMKMEASKAEDLQFEIFNTLNSTDDFDITCEWRASTGTKIKQRVCDVGYIKKAKAVDAYVSLVNSSWHMRTDNQLAVEFADKYKVLKKEMTDMTIQHPELATAMMRAVWLQHRYEAEHRKQFKDSKLLGNPETDENYVYLNEIDFWQNAFLDHRKGVMPDDIWERWDKWCRTKLQKKSYRTLWAVSVNHREYADDFIAYINTIISGE
jgi:hypothetical protein